MEDRLEAILVEMQKLSEESRRLRAQNDQPVEQYDLTDLLYQVEC